MYSDTMHFMNKNEVVNPVEGKRIDITEVNDTLFSQKLLGDGFAVIPSDEKIVSPVDGEVLTITPTKHAIGLKAADGTQILIHIGIDTMKLNGEHFESFVSAGDKISKGQALVSFDYKKVAEKGFDTSVIVCFPG